MDEDYISEHKDFKSAHEDAFGKHKDSTRAHEDGISLLEGAFSEYEDVFGELKDSKSFYEDVSGGACLNRPKRKHRYIIIKRSFLFEFIQSFNHALMEIFHSQRIAMLSNYFFKIFYSE